MVNFYTLALWYHIERYIACCFVGDAVLSRSSVVGVAVFEPQTE